MKVCFPLSVPLLTSQGGEAVGSVLQRWTRPETKLLCLDGALGAWAQSFHSLLDANGQEHESRPGMVT